MLCVHIQMHTHCSMRVPPFGNLRFIRYLLLTAAYRSLSRPSSASGAKASALCSFLLDQSPDVASSGLFFTIVTQCEMFSGFLGRIRSIYPRIFMLSFVKTCLTVYTRYSFSIFALHKFYSVFNVHGGPGWTRTTDLTLIRRAL